MSTTLSYWPYKTYNWGRWPNDRGTLNLLSEATTARAIASVKTHRTFALGAPLRADEIAGDARTYQHKMLRVGDYIYGPEGEPVQEAADLVSVAIHGMTNSHIDAYNHVGHHGKSFNGANFTDNVSRETGGSRYTMMDNPAIVTRAWLVDVPQGRGVSALKRGTPVLADDLIHLRDQVEPGDALEHPVNRLNRGRRFNQAASCGKLLAADEKRGAADGPSLFARLAGSCD